MRLGEPRLSVRATVVDSASHGFRTIVPHECVFDRALTPHRLNLFDRHAKYALACSLAETLRWLGQRAHSMV